MKPSSKRVPQHQNLERYRETGGEVLRMLIAADDVAATIWQVIATLRARLGLDAVGIRLQDGEDYPYFSQQGFSEEFLAAENSLLAREPDGGICRYSDGRPCLECTCGLVISGRTDPSNPIFTVGGSCWLNNSSNLLKLPSSQDPRLHPRNRCVLRGYGSVALIPLRNRDRIVGLVQLNALRRGCFSLEAIEIMEGIAAHLGATLMRLQSEQALQQAHDELEMRVEERTRRLQLANEQLKQEVAERQHLEARNRQLLKAECLGRMAAALAHHFNNQLQSVMLALEAAAQVLPQENAAAELLTQAKESSCRAAEVSTQMLMYLGQSRGPHEAVNLASVCEQTIARLREVQKCDIILERPPPDIGPLITANEKEIQQVLTCLLTNAWEAMEGEKGAVRVHCGSIAATDIPQANRFPIEWQPQSVEYAVLAISDPGRGIPKDDIEMLFDPFFSTKRTGRGLGLPIVLGLTRSHQGAIVVSSELGRGSVFRVFLPLATKPARTSPVPATPSPKPGAVLVVDDEPSVRQCLKLTLQRRGHTVFAAKDGVEAVEIFQIRQSEIGCVLCDVTMPRMNGWETLAALRKTAPALPVLLASGYSEIQVMSGRHSEEPHGFLQKPFDLKDLVSAIERFVSAP